jgi:hypothetical protein
MASVQMNQGFRLITISCPGHGHCSIPFLIYINSKMLFIFGTRRYMNGEYITFIRTKLSNLNTDSNERKNS